MLRHHYFAILIFLLSSDLVAQHQIVDTLQPRRQIDFNYKSLIIPTVLIGYGVVGLESDQLKEVNSDANEELTEQVRENFAIDDISQYVPFVSVYTLNAAGIRGKNNFRDRTIILGTASLIMATSVYSIKTVNVKRPDGRSQNSFPSGHTATAFMGAEFLFQEYKKKSIWYGVSGYAIAVGTGFFRLYNNSHWITDVATGAGIGIVSTKIAYWIHPLIKRTFLKNNENVTGIIIPFHDGKVSGIMIVMSF